MKTTWYTIAGGKLHLQTIPFNPKGRKKDKNAEYWIDIDDATSFELKEFLQPIGMHPLLLSRCIDHAMDPGVLVYENSVLMEYPAAFDRELSEPAYLTIYLLPPYLITIRHKPMPVLDNMIINLLGVDAPEIHHLAQITYLILDEFTDLNVSSQIEIRDQLLHLAKTLADNPGTFDLKKLAHLRWQVGDLISLVENQLYCVSGLSALDIKELQEPHRKAYIQDLLSEAEITQRGAYRLENRVTDLYNDYQMAESGRVEKRLRLLTIVSAITLPLGLLAGL
ncbi:MAG: CorA family divalent cation transporter, partial [Anaerolineaceae bacterium]